MANEGVTVQTHYGAVRGTKKQSKISGQEFFSFQGIPYAKAPLGNLRFKDPIEPEKWTDVLDCTQQCLPCYHLDRRINEITGSEDSLRVNVFTRKIDRSKPLPVMVYIYGGGFTEGTSGTELYGPDYLVQKDIVLVSFNYRTGALGFLCCQSPEVGVPGNAGLKDQVLALKWVAKNIVAFGGDPTNVTLFGHSAGGCSVQYHMISEASKNLFQRGIIMSGSTFCGWSSSPQRKWPAKLAKSIGWSGEGDETAALEYLRQASPVDIVTHQDKLFGPQEIQEGLLTPFGPTVEPYVSANCFIPKTPLEMSRNAWGNAIDAMVGGTSEEGILVLKKILPNLAEVMKNPHLIPAMIPYNLHIGIEERMAFAAKLKQMYYPNSEPSADNVDGYIALATDSVFWHGLHRTVASRVNNGNAAKTFVYNFCVDSPFFNHYRIHMVDPKIRGACHADEISYLFSNIMAEQLPDENTFEYRSLQTMVDIFTSFAITGNPNCQQTATVSWEPVAPGDSPFKCLNITNDGIAYTPFPNGQRMKLWDSIYVKDALY